MSVVGAGRTGPFAFSPGLAAATAFGVVEDVVVGDGTAASITGRPFTSISTSSGPAARVSGRLTSPRL